MANSSAGFFWLLGDEARRLHEHAAGAAGGVEDASVEGLDDLGEQLDDARRRVELAALLPLGAGERGRDEHSFPRTNAPMRFSATTLPLHRLDASLRKLLAVRPGGPVFLRHLV